MKRILLAFCLTLFASCSELIPSDGQFIVKDVDENAGYSKYWIQPAIKGLGNIYFYDSVAKYHVGDTLIFVKKHE